LDERSEPRLVNEDISERGRVWLGGENKLMKDYNLI